MGSAKKTAGLQQVSNSLLSLNKTSYRDMKNYKKVTVPLTVNILRIQVGMYKENLCTSML